MVLSRSKESWYVLQDDPHGSANANESEPIGPKIPFVLGSSLRTGHRERLAGDATGPEVCSGNSSRFDGADVSEVGDSGPVFFEDAAGVRIDLRERDGFVPDFFKANREPSDPAEPINYPH